MIPIGGYVFLLTNTNMNMKKYYQFSLILTLSILFIGLLFTSTVFAMSKPKVCAEITQAIKRIEKEKNKAPKGYPPACKKLYRLMAKSTNEEHIVKLKKSQLSCFSNSNYLTAVQKQQEEYTLQLQAIKDIILSLVPFISSGLTATISEKKQKRQKRQMWNTECYDEWINESKKYLDL